MGAELCINEINIRRANQTPACVYNLVIDLHAFSIK
jgi:hypothetical protein